jgi:very-short-patch-repair endonuclease
MTRMSGYRKRPRAKLPPPPAGGGEPAPQAMARGRGTTQRSRDLRAASSEAEQKLWRFLRRRYVRGLRFRRPFPLGPYFADFVCLPSRLIVEVDGSQHLEAKQMAHDLRRTKWLEANGFCVLRFWASDVMANIDGVFERIDFFVRSPPPPNASRAARSICSLPQGEGGDSALADRKRSAVRGVSA